MACVYLLTSPSGKQYVGWTKKTANWRWSIHKRSCLPSQRPQTAALYPAMMKYNDWDTWTVETIFEGTNEECTAREREEILARNTLAPNGYNISLPGGGFTQVNWTDESRQIMSDKAKSQWKDPEFRSKTQAALSFGRSTKTEKATKARRNAAKKANEALRKKWQDPEFREMMSKKRRELWNTPDYRKSTIERIRSGMQRTSTE